MKKATMVLVVCLLSVNCVQAEPKSNLIETKKYLSTNGWDTCVKRYDQGLIQNWNFINYNYIQNVDSIWIATNISRFGYYHIDYKCDKEHLTDYPKKNESVNGVQWVHEYEQLAIIDGFTNKTSWTKYDFPHLKIVTITIQEIKIVTTVTTNITKEVDTKCKECGRR